MYTPVEQHDCPNAFDNQPAFDVAEWGILEGGSPNSLVVQGECRGCDDNIQVRLVREEFSRGDPYTGYSAFSRDTEV